MFFFIIIVNTLHKKLDFCGKKRISFGNMRKKNEFLIYLKHFFS
jgi:hypothetical protein